MYVKMEGEVINSFLPDLVTAVSDSVLSVSDQCLAKGLINETVYKRVLESGGTSEDKARTLILAVKKSTETDSRCLEILLNILEQELPFAIREILLSNIRKELTEKANTCRAVVPLSKAVQPVPLGELSKETTLQQSFLLGRFEDSIRQHEHACAEKKLLEERLKVKSEKCERLKGELETLKHQNQELASNTQSRIAACTNQIENLKKRIEELQKTIEEQGMQARRGRNMIITETKKMLVQLVQQNQQEIQRREEEVVATKKDKPSDLLEQHYLVPLCKSMNSSAQGRNDPTQLLQILECFQNFALQLGFTIKEEDDLNPYDNKHIDYIIKKIMSHWLQWHPGDTRGSTNYPTYSHLKQALTNAELGHVADNLISYEELSKYKVQH